MRSKIYKINLLTPDPDDATGFYRAHGPYNHVRLNIDGVIIDSQYNINQRTMTGYDLIVMHRPFNAAHVQIIKLANSQGIPVLVDYDDDLINLPVWHKTYGKIVTQNHVNSIKWILNNVNAITVSTENLKHSLQQHVTDLDIQVIENYLPYPYPQAENVVHNPEPVFKLLWRGGPAHNIDVNYYQYQLSQFCQNHSGKVEITAIADGEPLSMFTHPSISNHATVKLYHKMELTEYFYFLATSPAHAIMVMQHKSVWSDAISANAWAEALHGAMLCVKPDHWYHAQLPFTYDTADPATFLLALEDLYNFYYENPKQWYNQIEIERQFIKHIAENAMNKRINLISKLLK